MKFLDSNNRHAIMDGESLGSLNPTQRIAGYYGMVRAGETVSPIKNTPTGLFSTKWSARKTCK